LYAKLQDKGRPGLVPAGEPRCGTMLVDVVGTAKGVWAEPTVTTPVAGDETRYITLADYPYRPQDHLALSLAPQVLGARVAVVPRASAGRVNRAFRPGNGGRADLLLWARHIGAGDELALVAHRLDVAVHSACAARHRRQPVPC